MIGNHKGDSEFTFRDVERKHFTVVNLIIVFINTWYGTDNHDVKISRDKTARKTMYFRHVTLTRSFENYSCEVAGESTKTCKHCESADSRMIVYWAEESTTSKNGNVCSKDLKKKLTNVSVWKKRFRWDALHWIALTLTFRFTVPL